MLLPLMYLAVILIFTVAGNSRRLPVMHRDLNLPTVLLSEERVAKIADVGMVRPQVQELVTAQPIMTPLWAAPEVCTS